MPKSTNHKRDESRHIARDMRPRGTINMAAQEVVNGDIPLPRELEPVAGIPPVGVEVAVGEAGDFGKGAKDVFEDDEEDEEEGDHEGEEEHADAFGEDEAFVRHALGAFETGGGFAEDGDDEFFACDC